MFVIISKYIKSKVNRQKKFLKEVNDGNACGVWLLWNGGSYNPSTKEVIGIE